jgi:hypothetical protein
MRKSVSCCYCYGYYSHALTVVLYAILFDQLIGAISLLVQGSAAAAPVWYTIASALLTESHRSGLSSCSTHAYQAGSKRTNTKGAYMRT